MTVAQRTAGWQFVFRSVCILILMAGRVAPAPVADISSPPAITATSLAAQERARSLAAELVRGVIDVQLRQLEENGLADRPIFGDIKSLRGVVAALVQREMKDVTDLLSRAEEATPAERPALVSDARNLARTIVTRLAAERQQILRRLKEAMLAAQVRAIVDRQKRLLTATESLSTLPDGRREQTTLAAIEEERNVKTLVATLQAALADVGNWGGEIGATSLAGLRTLEREGVSEAVAAAESQLAQADPAGAAAAQRRAIAGLEAVLATVEGNRSARPAGADAGKEAAALGGKAAEMRREMAKVPLTDASVEKLLAEQSALQEALAKFAADLRGEPAAGLVEQAKAASLEAAAGLLEGDQRRAVAAQDTVIERLAEVAAGLDDRQPARAPASAAEFARRAAELMDVFEKVEAFARRQDEINRVSRDQPEAAAEAERGLAAGLAELVTEQSHQSPDGASSDDTRPLLPFAVEQRIAAAADATAEVTRAPTPQATESALHAATDALQAAAREIARAVADAERATLAAKAGELSRAAEVAERAAAAERGIAQAARQAVEPGRAAQDAEPERRQGGSAGDEPRSHVDSLVARQAEVAAIAGQVEDAVDGLAPEAAEMMAQAQAAMQAAREQLEARAAGAERVAEAREAAASMAAVDGPAADQSAGAMPAATPAATEQPPADPANGAADPAPAEPGPLTAAEAAGRAAEALAEAAAAMRADARQATAEAAQVAAVQQEAAAGGDPAAQSGLRKQQNELEAKANDLSRAAQLADRAAAAERGIAEALNQAGVGEQADARQPGEATSDEAAAAATRAQELAAKQAELAAVAETVENALEGVSPAAAEKMAAARAAIEAAREQLIPPATVDGFAGETAADGNPTTNENSGKQSGQQAAGDQAPNQDRPGDQAAAAEKMAAAQAAAEQASQAAAAAAEQAAESLVAAAAAMRDQAKQAAEELARLAARQAAEAGEAGSAAQETALARDEIVAEEIAAALREQAAAREEIAAQAAMLDQPPAGQAAAVDLQQAAAALAEAKERFAVAQRDIGERVAAALDQREIGNQPLRESLAAAAQGDLGTNFQPESPETTADMIAGEPANAAAEQALAAGDGRQGQGEGQPQQGEGKGEGKGEGEGTGQGQQASSEVGDQQSASQSSGSQQASSQQQASEQTSSSGSRVGEALDDGPLQEIATVDRRSEPGSRERDADAVEKSFERDAWFAKLPPEVRKAIRAGSERRAPRGYEEKMNRYFKNIE
ncbi:MAG: hypothetical protein WED27_00810 [Pirellulales bacterium]